MNAMKLFSMRKMFLAGTVVAVATAVGCQSGSGSASGNGLGVTKGALVVLHTKNQIFALKAADVNASAKLKERVDGFYAAGLACEDRDNDDDGVPDAEDDSAGSSTG